MNIKSFIQRYQLVSYFLLAYGITWSGILILIASKGFQLTAIHMQEVLLMFLLMLLGPSSGSLLLHAVLEGRNGLHALRLRLTRWRVGLFWYAIALLTIPVLFLTILSLLRVTLSPAFAPRFQIIGLAVGLLAGGLEEIGWTGFATPRLLNKYNPLKAGFILGLLWALWHILADFSGNIGTMGTGWLLWFPLYWILPLTAYRILMTWVYANTRSLLVAQLMHASYTGWLFVLSPAASFNQNLLWQTVFVGVLWTLVAVVFVLNRRKDNFETVL